jgi:hypothetical protein
MELTFPSYFISNGTIDGVHRLLESLRTSEVHEVQF